MVTAGARNSALRIQFDGGANYSSQNTLPCLLVSSKYTVMQTDVHLTFRQQL
jgi:hypothetical protein